MVVYQLFLFFIMGFLFKKYFHYSEDMGQIFSKLILNITLPATIFLSASTTTGFAQAYLLPLAAFVLQLVVFAFFYLLARKLNLSSDVESVFITTPLCTNTLLFLAPFIYLSYGDVGLTRLILYDIGNALTIFCIAQPILRFYGSASKFNLIAGIKTVLSSFPLWAFILGLTVNWLNLTVPNFIVEPLTIIKDLNIFLPIFVLGFYFVPSLANVKLALFTSSAKMLLGLVIGIGISQFFVNPMDKATIILAASAPVGLMSLIFAAEYDRDTKFTSDLVSYSMILGFILCTVLDYIFRSLGYI